MKNLSSICIFLLACLLNAHATKHTITASGTSFNPNNIPNVFVGDTIRWQWGNGSHTTTSTSVPNGAATWNSSLNSGSPSFEYPVTVAGTYDYRCIPHGSMGMTGTFTAAAVTTPCDTIDCNDNNACTTDTCTNSTCVNTQIICDDGDPCTTDACVNGICSFTPIVCDDINVCTTDTCDNGICNFTVITCDDGDVCTRDSCLDFTGCLFPNIPGCNDPCDTLTCADGDPCTTDACSNGNCVFTPIVCNDNNPCTNDACNNGPCQFTPIVCDDGDSCTIDACSNGICQFTDMVCNDGDSCTTDACSGGICVFTDIPGCPVGINEPASLNLAVYPNPVHGVLTIEGSNALLTRITLTDISGKQVYASGKLNSASHTIQTKEFPGGVYLLHIDTNVGQAVRKIRVE